MSAKLIFRPQPRTAGKIVRHINYTCSPERYEELEVVAHDHGVSLKELLRQMVEFSIAHLEGTKNNDPS